MKKLVSIIILCLGCLGILEAQENIWKPINGTGIIGAAPDGSIFAYGEYGTLSRSQDDGESWQIVLGQETGFTGHINSSCFAVSPEGRICVFNDNQQTVVYSDDNGDTWQQTTVLSSCGMPTKAGICAPTNDIMVVWAENGEISYTLDGGETWDGWILDFLENSESVSDLLVNENGDVYVSVSYYIMNIVGIYHSTLSDIQNWELVAFEGISVKDMAFDPDGNVVACGYNADGSSVGFQHIPGFYLFDGTSLAISDDGIVYTPHFMGLQAVLSYSIDHGEHFTEIGEHLPLVDIAPGGENPRLFKGYDNHLYFDGGGEYWKCIPDADEITNYGNYVPLVHEGNDRQKWNVVSISAVNWPNDYHTEIQSIRDNITLDGVDYKLVWKEDVYDSKRIAGAVREEDKRVYFRRKIEQNYQDEVLLYDFNLTVGDTVNVNWFDQKLGVLEESEVQVNGNMRRMLGLAEYYEDGTIGEVEEYWIEGVGSTYGFLNSGYEAMVGAYIQLLCYHENSNLVWDNEEFEDCVMNSDGTLASFAPQGAEWYFHVLSQGPITEPPFYYLKSVVTGTEEIQGHLCSVIDGYRYVYEEDGVVYMYNHSTDSFTVMYDFNAEEGDTWYCDIEEGYTCLVTVESVDSVTWNGHTYRTQYVTGYIPDEGFLIYDGRIIEGIGYEKGLFPHEFVYDGTEYAYMRCYLEDGELLYHEGDYDCDYEPGTVTNQFFPLGTEWYYKIKHVNGAVTYQHLEYTADTAVNSKRVKIITETNTMYDKSTWINYEFIYEDGDRIYWWNKDLEDFTLLYDFGAEAGDEWEINGGWYTITVHVDGVEEMTIQGKPYRVLHVTDPNYQLFTGDIICGIGHQKSFFPEGPMVKDYGYVVDGLRCYWQDGELVLTMDGEDCDAVYYELHGMDENDNASFTIYPNPTDGIITVESQSNASLQEYRITNVLGQTVQMGDLTGRQIDIRNLTQGMYFITIGKKTQKIIVK